MCVLGMCCVCVCLSVWGSFRWPGIEQVKALSSVTLQRPEQKKFNSSAKGDRVSESCGWCRGVLMAGDQVVDAHPQPSIAELHFRAKTEADGWPGEQNNSRS
ncbi:hypothetical protein F5144DRAFT_587275 [Chaetomium tenue]|uniref:Uncharacterized protein n=1 Tax=Chaetomium tenue TaxID=1854479 RepID=A0ACB7NTT8_9PEZI|nr:hypothetical protein F5144DRAFT_587275 [Chaetomium globosum]